MQNKGIYLPSTILSYVKPLRVSPARNRTRLEVSMRNHWLNNIIIAVVGGWHVAKQPFLSLWFLHCTYLSFIFDALQISFNIICRINCRYFCVFQASEGKHGAGIDHQTRGTEGRRKTVCGAYWRSTPASRLPSLTWKTPKKWRQFCRLY